jgi:hypothetical protein
MGAFACTGEDASAPEFVATVPVAATVPTTNAVAAPREVTASQLRRAGSEKAVCPASANAKNPESSISDTVMPTTSAVSQPLAK